MSSQKWLRVHRNCVLGQYARRVLDGFNQASLPRRRNERLPRTVVLMGTRLKVEYPVARGVWQHKSRFSRNDSGVGSFDARRDKSLIAKAVV
jgi:hypothetical protein